MNDVVNKIVDKHNQAAVETPSYHQAAVVRPPKELESCRFIRPPKDGYIIERQCKDSNQLRQPGLLCHFGCNQGFSMTGKSVLKCNPTGWSSAPPRCKKATCSRLTPSEGMTIEPIHCRAGDIRPGLTCDVSCWNNYVFNNPATKTIHLTCKRDGLWVSWFMNYSSKTS